MCAIDITAEQRKTVLALLARHLPNTTAWVYGSRVKWTSRPESDLDLVVFAKPEQERRVSDLREAFEESNLPFRVDLFVWDTVPEQFRKTIEAEHVVLVEREERGVGGEWPIMSLREAGVSLIDCEHRTPPAAERGYPYVAIPQVKDGRINLNGVRRITRERFDEWTRKADPKSFDIVLSRRCNPGETGFVSEGLKFALGQNLVLLRSDGTKVFKPFLRWLVRGPRWWDQVGVYINVGAVFDSLKCGDIPGFRLPIPPLPEQRSIAHVLGTLDDKIELNRQMNQTLEDMARALFKSWFVDFDPVHAKATLKHHAATLPQGGSDWSVERARAYLDRMDPDIAAVFPDTFVDSELGPIPEGWEVGCFGDVVELMPDKENPLAFPDAIFRLFSIPAFDENQWPNAVRGENIKSQKSRVLPGAVLLSKLNPEIERVWLVDVDASDRAVCSTEFLVLQPRPPFCRNYAYCLTRSPLFRQQIESLVTGTSKSHQRAPASAILSLGALIPPALIVKAFEIFASELLNRNLANRSESRVCSTLRDKLLPKLMSGKVRVMDEGKYG